MDNARTSVKKVSEILLKKFQEGRMKNPRWSQRAFAQRLGLSSGAVSEMMKGKRTISGPLKKKIAHALQLSPSEYLDFFAEEIPGQLKPVRHEYFRLSSDQFHLISDWWHFAILNLLKTKGFRPELAWLTQRLGLSRSVVAEGWERLLRLGYLKQTAGKIVRQHPRIETTDDFFDLSVRKAHLEDTKLIEQSLLGGELEQRDHSSMTLTISRKDMKKAKELIRIFQDQFCEEIETKANQCGDEVYRLSISFFPLTKTKEKP